MDVLLTIGEFSKMTYLSVKALRHYHDVGLLEPAVVDPFTGYRRYAPAQVATAQAIRRFRDLGMPLDDVRQVLTAPDERQRNRVLLAHLDRLHRQLEQTQATVASLQALLGEEPHGLGDVELRRLPATRALTTRQVVAFVDCGAWLPPVLDELHARAATAGLDVAGPDGALYSDAFFEQGVGDVTAFVPVVGDGEDIVDIPAVTVAVLGYDGPFADLDKAYAALGTTVVERGIAAPGPIREHYPTDTRTEVCWPVAEGAGH